MRLVDYLLLREVYSYKNETVESFTFEAFQCQGCLSGAEILTSDKKLRNIKLRCKIINDFKERTKLQA